MLCFISESMLCSGSRANPQGENVRDTRGGVTLLVGTRVTSQRHGYDGVVASEPFRESPDEADRRARVLVYYADSTGGIGVDYVRDLQVVGDKEWMAGLTRLAAMSCKCDPFDPCLSCVASHKAAAYERVSAQRARHGERRP